MAEAASTKLRSIFYTWQIIGLAVSHAKKSYLQPTRGFSASHCYLEQVQCIGPGRGALSPSPMYARGMENCPSCSAVAKILLQQREGKEAKVGPILDSIEISRHEQVVFFVEGGFRWLEW